MAAGEIIGKKVKILRCPATVNGDENRTMPLDSSSESEEFFVLARNAS